MSSLLCPKGPPTSPLYSRSWADFKEEAAPPRALRTNVSIYLSSPSPAAVFLMEILSGTADGTPHTHQLRSSTDPQVMIWVFAVHFWYFYCPGYRGMYDLYVQGVSSKSFKQLTISFLWIFLGVWKNPGVFCPQTLFKPSLVGQNIHICLRSGPLADRKISVHFLLLSEAGSSTCTAFNFGSDY